MGNGLTVTLHAVSNGNCLLVHKVAMLRTQVLSFATFVRAPVASFVIDLFCLLLFSYCIQLR